MPLRRFDERLLHALTARRHPHLDRLMRGVTHLGGAVSTISICLLAMSGLVPSLVAVGRRAAVTLAVSHLIVQVLKRTVSRARPALPVGFAFLVEPPDRYSFPSGHVAASLAVTLPFAAALPLMVAPLPILLALLIGVSRSYLGVHYPGDVAAGWFLAMGTYLVLIG